MQLLEASGVEGPAKHVLPESVNPARVLADERGGTVFQCVPRSAFADSCNTRIGVNTDNVGTGGEIQSPATKFAATPATPLPARTTAAPLRVTTPAAPLPARTPAAPLRAGRIVADTGNLHLRKGRVGHPCAESNASGARQ